MKNCMRIVSLCLVLVMMFGATVGVQSSDLSDYAEGFKTLPLDYSVPKEFIDYLTRGDETGYLYWYRNIYPEYDDPCEALAYIWYYYTYPEKTENTIPEYLEVYSKLLEENLTKESCIDPSVSALRVDGYSWNEDILTVEYSGDFNVKYGGYIDEDNGLPYYGAAANPDWCELALALRNKSDGKLVFLSKASGKIEAEYRYGNGGRVEEGKSYTDYDGIEYNCTVTKSSEVKMPDMFDSKLHDIQIYFEMNQMDDVMYGPELYAIWGPHILNPAYPISSEGYSKPEPEPEPVRGDANGDGVLGLTDVSLVLKYVAGWDVVIDLELANINGDTGITVADASRLLKVIAGWDV